MWNVEYGILNVASPMRRAAQRHSSSRAICVNPRESVDRYHLRESADRHLRESVDRYHPGSVETGTICANPRYRYTLRCMRLCVPVSTALLVLFAIPASPAERQTQRPNRAPTEQWRQIESKEVGLRFRLPVQWQTKTATRNGRSCLEAVSPRSTVYLQACSFRDANIELEDLLDQTLDDLGVDLDDDPDVESLNGLDALVGETTATFEGRDLGMFIIVAAHGDTRYVVHLMTKAALFDANARTMNRIVDSLAPAGGGAR